MNHVRYFATFCIVSGTYTTIGLVIAWCKRLCQCGAIAIASFLTDECI